MLAATRLLALFVEWSFESERKISLLSQICSSYKNEIWINFEALAESTIPAFN
jgi:hypothetical protein